jgi:hypothetical protein
MPVVTRRAGAPALAGAPVAAPGVGPGVGVLDTSEYGSGNVTA